MKYKIIILVIATIFLLALNVSGAGCSDESSNDAESFMKKVPKVIDNISFVNVETLRDHEELEDLYESFEDNLGDITDVLGIDFNDVKNLSGSESASGYILLIEGDFNLNDIREELEDQGFTDADYKDVEIWENDYTDGVIALMRDLIILSTEDDAKDCIKVIKDGDDSMLDDNDCKDIMDRLPNGIMIEYGIDEEDEDENFEGLEASGHSSQIKGEDTVEITIVYKFRDEKAAEDAIDEIEEYIERYKGEQDEVPSENVKIDQQGEFVTASGETDLDGFIDELS